MLAFEDQDVRMSSSIRFGFRAQFVYPESKRGTDVAGLIE